MSQIKYAWDDLKSQKARNIILILQITAALLIFSFVLSLYFNLFDFRDKLNYVSSNQDIYYIRDVTDESRYIEFITDPNSIEKMNELYSFMTTSFDVFTASSQEYLFLKDEGLDPFVVYHSGTSKAFNLLKIDQNFASVYDLNCVEGELFTSEDFQSEGTIPLLLGYDFQKYYQLGDIITDTHDVRYQVRGFLEKSSYFLQPGKSDEVYLLDSWFVVPLTPEIFMDSADFDPIIMSTYIFADDASDLEKIRNKSTELDLYSLEFRSFAQQMQWIREDFNLLIKLIGFILVVVLLFSIIGLVSNITQFIDSHIKEFSIHLLCGGQVRSIIQRIVVTIGLMLLPACILAIAIHRFTATTIITLLFSIFIGGVVAIFPAIKLSRLGIINLLRRSE